MRTMEIIFENADFLVLNKPSGLQVHPARIAEKKLHKRQNGHEAESVPTLTGWLVEHYPEVRAVGDDPAMRPGIVHRLDKATSGVMVVPRNQKTFEYLKNLFQKHEVEKTYLALVRGTLKKRAGTIDAPIGIKNGTLKRSIHATKMAKPAVTEYKVIKEMEKGGEAYSLLEVKPKTGRTHQIRVHLASIGHPIVGDRLYGPTKQPGFADRLMLHAQGIAFNDGHGSRFEFESKAPKAFGGVV